MSKRVPLRNYDLFASFSYFTPWVKEIAYLLLWMLVGALLGNLVTGLFTVFLGAELALTYGMLVAYPVMFIPPMMYAMTKSRFAAGFDTEPDPIDRNGFGPYSGWLLALLVVFTTLGTAFMTDLLNNLMPEMPESLKAALESQTTGPLWANLLSVSIFAPLCEEWLCRGMVLRGLLHHKKEDGSSMKPATAIVISALFFAFIHLNPWQAIPAFLIGCLLGYVYYKTGSLKLTMLMHCANNTFAVAVSHIDSLSDYENWVEALGSVNYGIVFLLCAVLLVFCISVFKRI